MSTWTTVDRTDFPNLIRFIVFHYLPSLIYVVGHKDVPVNGILIHPEKKWINMTNSTNLLLQTSFQTEVCFPFCYTFKRKEDAFSWWDFDFLGKELYGKKPWSSWKMLKVGSVPDCKRRFLKVTPGTPNKPFKNGWFGDFQPFPTSRFGIIIQLERCRFV